MRTYKVVVKGFDSGLNEVLAGRCYDFRTRKYRNPVKTLNDKICCNAIKFSKDLKGKKIDKPIIIHYDFYCKNKRRDKMNIFAAFDKSFEDSLQLCNVIKNDGWKEIVNTEHEFYVDELNPRVEVTIREIKVDG